MVSVMYVLCALSHYCMLDHQIVIVDMTLEDVRKYESDLQNETNKRVVDGVNLEEANQPI